MKVHKLWYEQNYHLVKTASWQPSKTRMIGRFINHFCNPTIVEVSFGKMDTYEPYDAKKHRKLMCDKCILHYKAYLKQKQQALKPQTA